MSTADVYRGSTPRLASVGVRNYTVATVPSASQQGAGAIIYVSNGATNSPVLAYSNGTTWLRSDTAAAIST